MAASMIMSIICNLILMASLMGCLRTFADDGTNGWGATACGVQMSLTLKNSDKDINTNQAVILEVRLKNVSSDIINIVRTDPVADFSYLVTLPSGKIISKMAKDVATDNDFIIQRQLFPLKPNDTCLFPRIDLRSVCNLNETGTYSVTVKRRMPFPYAQGCEVVSNPLYFSAISGEREPEATNAPQIGF
jgi:hypothetical protein